MARDPLDKEENGKELGERGVWKTAEESRRRGREVVRDIAGAKTPDV